MHCIAPARAHTSRGSNAPVLFVGSLALFLGTVLTFQQVTANGFINFDDPTYVQDNPLVHGGLTPENFQRAFTSFHAGYWIPLTWVSYQIDYSLYGFAPAGFHSTNLLLHAITAVLLFLLLCRLSGTEPRIGRCLLAAALFAVHPVQVESVAWITERKDVLSTLFLVLTLWMYVRYVEQPSRGRYALVALFFTLGLMAKPMLVTLPCMLLLLDWWPLRRTGWRWLVVEKLPLFALAVAGGLVCIAAQAGDRAVRTLTEFPIDLRIGNAIVSYVDYLGMLLWPRDLAVFYPHPGRDLSPVRIILCGGLLLVLTVAAILLRKRAPYLLFGWLWYLGTLAPVSGLLQAGWQGKADRFLYVPAIGLFVAASWGLADLAGTARRRRIIAACASAMILAACVVQTYAQVPLWKDSLTLWEHTVSVTPENFIAEDCMGAALLDDGRPRRALNHFLAARSLKPDHELSHYYLGVAYRRLGDKEAAARSFRAALAISPQYPEARAALADVSGESEQ